MEQARTTNGMSAEGADLLDASNVAKILGVTEQWVRDHTTRIEPIIPHVRMARKVRFRPADIRRFIDQQAETRPKWERVKVSLGERHGRAVRPPHADRPQ